MATNENGNRGMPAAEQQPAAAYRRRVIVKFKDHVQLPRVHTGLWQRSDATRRDTDVTSKFVSSRDVWCGNVVLERGPHRWVGPCTAVTSTIVWHIALLELLAVWLGLKRIIKKKVLHELSKQILTNSIGPKSKILMDVFDGTVVFRQV